MANFHARSVIVLFLVVTSVIDQIAGHTIDLRPKAKAGTFRKAAVATDTDLCSPIGASIMEKQGGSAVDATIVSFLCTCVLNMESCGIGGGFVATVYDTPKNSNNKVMATITAREKAPIAASENMYVADPTGSTKGGLAIGVPGEIYGFYEAWKKFGKLPWKQLFTDVIRICDEGFKIERALAEAIQRRVSHIREDPNLMEVLVHEDGSLKKEGDILVNKKLARTFERIAEDPMSFYSGSLAEDILADLEEYNSIITKKDLASYGKTSVWKEPMKINLKNGNFTIYNVPPPSSGVVLDFMLNILDGYNFGPDSISSTEKKVLTYHRIAEAFKFAYAKRSQLGDNEFVNVEKLVENMLSRDYASEIREQIDDLTTHELSYYGASFDIENTPGTSHMNLLAPDGSAVALTGTINTDFGSKVRGSRTGIMFNNEMDDFSTPGTVNYFGVPASPSNYIRPGKRPMSSMSPSIILGPSGNVVLLAGAEGGSRITTSTALMIMDTLWFGLDVEEASNTARIHHQLAPHHLEWEHWMDKELVDQLGSKNHVMQRVTSSGVSSVIQNVCEMGKKAKGGFNPIHFPKLQGLSEDFGEKWDKIQEKLAEILKWFKMDEGCIRAVSDGRKGGSPAGF